MNFSFIDKILTLHPGKYALATRYVSAKDEPYLALASSSNKYNLLSCMLAEAIGQLCAWLVMQQNNFSLRPVAILYGALHLYDNAYLGDTLTVETTLKTLDDKTSLFDGRVSVNDKILFEVNDAAGAFLPMTDFIDPIAVKEEFLSLLPQQIPPDPPLKKGGQGGFNCDQNHPLSIDYTTFQWLATEKQLIATKTIPLNAPYFLTHFPRKPVLPISILLQGKIHLGQHFLTQIFPNLSTTNYLARKISQVKINEFILPNSHLTTLVTLKNCTESTWILSFKTSIENKKVCTAVIEYTT